MKLFGFFLLTVVVAAMQASDLKIPPNEPASGNLPAPQLANAWTIPDLGMDFVWIPSSKEAGPPFWLGRTEVTQKQFAILMGHNFSEFKGEDLPVQNVDWIEAMAFCRKLTDKERAAGRLPADYELTLPSEAQWEFACRAGSKGDYPGNIDDMAWYFLNSGGKPHPVAKKQPNAWGLYDMLGNVAEWCLNGASLSSAVPPALTAKIIRGGSWRIAAAQASSSFKILYTAGIPENTVGFRVALSAVDVTKRALIPALEEFRPNSEGCVTRKPSHDPG